MHRSVIALTLLVTVLSACFKDDERLKPYGGIITLIPDSIQLHRSYFDLESGRVVKSIANSSWQLGFECGSEGWHIITNSGSNWFMYNTGQTVTDVVVQMPSIVNGLYDVPAAFPDSTAVGNWITPSGPGNNYTNDVYLLGYYHAGKFMSIKQVQFLDVNDTSYRFFYKEQATGSADTVTILKNDSLNYIYYNFNSHEQVNLEPGKAEWDLVFGPYYDLATLFSVTIPYLVAGSMINTWQTEAVLDSTHNFDAINAGLISGYSFKGQRDIPGYRWKSVTVDVSGAGSATYKIKTNYTYIFHTAQDNYFKLKFLSYTHDGLSGFPQFEFRKVE